MSDAQTWLYARESRRAKSNVMQLDCPIVLPSERGLPKPVCESAQEQRAQNEAAAATCSSLLQKVALAAQLPTAREKESSPLRSADASRLLLGAEMRARKPPGPSLRGRACGAFGRGAVRERRRLGPGLLPRALASGAPSQLLRRREEAI